jgi:hypothetical protein
MSAADLLHATMYGTLPDPHAATKRRIAELESELARLKAAQEADEPPCETCGDCGEVAIPSSPYSRDTDVAGYAACPYCQREEW